MGSIAALPSLQASFEIRESAKPKPVAAHFTAPGDRTDSLL